MRRCFFTPVYFLLGVALYLVTGPSPHAHAQIADRHMLRIDVRGVSWVQVVVDQVIAFNGFLQPGEWRAWQGQQITLTIASAEEVTATLDGTTKRVLLDQSRQSITLHWPEKPAPPPTAPPTRPPTYYIIQPGDTLAVIAERFAIDLESLTRANQIANPNRIYAGTRLVIPSSDGTLPDPAQAPVIAPTGVATVTLPVRGSVVERLTTVARNAPTTSPFHKTIWLTYYGRPGVPIMGILGEHEIEPLTTLLQAQVQAYDEANGDDLAVQGAFHLVYGMATRAPGADQSHLAFLTDIH